ncbi:MAG: tRNA (adenosine(37)-N6)-threonylcarbamoyltransferase complex ATPase subunit type 1 TsaE [Bacteroidetes bacterium]|nr:tRNA (adenosine(37)-N6)-threonylcarbamoyltransferase complex ATPase subunit type 1 TsaE [Bacteroidota bacterium]
MSHTYPLSQIDQAAQWLLGQIGSARVICFQGEMGAGKTTLIQAICRQKGVEGSFGSPTYPIIHEYGLATGDAVVYHMDFYRLSGVDEAERSGVGEALHSGALCLVEWPERVPEMLSSDAVWVQIHVVDTDSRSLQLLNK